VDRSGFRSRQGQEVLFSKMSWPALGPSEPPIQWVLESVSGQGRDVDFCPSPSNEAENEWNYTSIPCICISGVNRDNFPFFHSYNHHYQHNLFRHF
jgi:hypothetical protein